MQVTSVQILGTLTVMMLTAVSPAPVSSHCSDKSVRKPMRVVRGEIHRSNFAPSESWLRK